MSHEWIPITPGLWRCAYSTSMGLRANSFALALTDGRLAVLSPAADADEALFAATEALGTVTALIANNTGHDLGQVAWQARYPAATTYAPAVAGPKVAKAKPALRPIRPLADLAPHLPPGVRLVDVPGTSSGMTVFAVETEGRKVVYIDEALNNDAELAGPLPFRLLMRLAGAGPGLVRNRIWWLVFAKDKPGILATLRDELRGATSVLVAHGETITDVEAARALLA